MLTRQETRALEHIKQHWERHGSSPSMQELAQAMGLNSRGLAHRYVQALKQKGHLEAHERKWRNLKIRAPEAGLPLMGKIAAGSPILTFEQQQSLSIEHWLQGPGRYALAVQGDSMIDEGIFDGDIVICQSTSYARSGQIIVALIDQQEATLKRIYYPDPENIELQPANGQYSAQRYPRSRITIQGIMLGLIRWNAS